MPLPPSHVTLQEFSEFLNVSLGSQTFSGWVSDSAIYSCGNNNCGQLGIGDQENKTTFQLLTALSGVKIVKVQGGWDFSLALTGELVGRFHSCLNGLVVHIVLEGKRWLSRKACTLVSDHGTVYGWGSNSFGQLCSDDFTRQNKSVRIVT